MKHKVINISEDFSDNPVGISYTDGFHNAEALRENILVPALKENDTVEVRIDNSHAGYAASFLKYAFGGIVEKGYFSSSELKRKLKIVCSEDFKVYEHLILDYIKNSVYIEKYTINSIEVLDWECKDSEYLPLDAPHWVKKAWHRNEVFEGDHVILIRDSDPLFIDADQYENLKLILGNMHVK